LAGSLDDKSTEREIVANQQTIERTTLEQPQNVPEREGPMGSQLDPRGNTTIGELTDEDTVRNTSNITIQKDSQLQQPVAQ
jgi:hypothetical protein